MGGDVGVVDEVSGPGGGPATVRSVLSSQRRRFLDRLAGLGGEDWHRPSRCPGWSVDDVARHVADGAEFHVDALAGRAGRLAGTGRFDPVTTPSAWLRASQGRPPAETLALLRRLAAEEDAFLQAQAQARAPDGGGNGGGNGDGATVRGPIGRRVHRSLLSLHVFWDAWVHERDVTLPFGVDVPVPAGELRAVTLYSLLLAAGAAGVAGEGVDVVVALAGSPDGAYRVVASPERARVSAAPGDPAALHGDVLTVLDALAGRGTALEQALTGPPSAVAPFTRLGRVLAG